MSLDKLSKVEKARLAEIMEDPVRWAKIFLKTFDGQKKEYTPWTARWYQANMLKDKSLKKVARCGRRTGKCLPGWVKVFDPTTGERKTMEELYKSNQANVLTMQDDFKISKATTNIVIDNGIKEVFNVRLKTGREIDATDNHPLYTINGWKEIKDIKVGDYIAVPSSLHYFGNEEVTDEKVVFTAYMIGDGNCKGKNARFSFRKSNQETRNNRTVKNDAKEFLIDVGLFGKGSKEKNIPDFVFRLNKKQTSLFLSRLFHTDGWAYSRTYPKNMAEIGYCSSSKQLIMDVQHLLLKFGIIATYKKKKVKHKGSYAHSYQLTITSKGAIKKFASEIGIFGKEDAVRLAVKRLEARLEEEHRIPKEIMEEVDAARISKGLLKKDLALSKRDRVRMKYAPDRTTLRHYGNKLQSKRFVDLSNSDIVWEKIESIESIGLHQTYDLTIPITHNFIANDIVVHNSETMVVDALHKAYTNKNYRVLIITPYENQVRLLFTRLRELVEGSPLVKEEVVRNTSSPFLMEFKNGSMVLGFTTGAASGSGAASIRGQRADFIIVDELDYLGPNDFDTITAIAAERDDIGIFCSSTPTGRRGIFYDMCTNKKLGYTEFHHPSTDNPSWTEKMEAEFKEQLSEQGYTHEIMAEFGVQQTGVFPKDKVDLACLHEAYTYDELSILQKNRAEENGLRINNINYHGRAPTNPFRCVGVDFDKFCASSSIVILDYDVNMQKFKVIKRIETPRAEYSYDAALNTILEVNEKYNPSWIYCDRGNSEYIIERLHIIGDEKPSTGLKNKVKGWQFKNTVEVIDPITKVRTKEPMKPFMVNQLTISFERERIMLSPFDEKLHKQLIDYEVVRIGQNGPVYSDENEHFVDALSLAHLAFVLEFPQLTNTIQQIEHKLALEHTSRKIGVEQANKMFRHLELGDVSRNTFGAPSANMDDLEGDRPSYIKLPLGYKKGSSRGSWGSRSTSGRGGFRSSW